MIENVRTGFIFPQLFPTLQDVVFGRQKITVNTPIKIPPKTRFNHPSKIYPSLALK